MPGQIASSDDTGTDRETFAIALEPALGGTDHGVDESERGFGSSGMKIKEKKRSHGKHSGRQIIVLSVGQ